MASSYQLKIELTPPQLEAFYAAGSQIAIAKSGEAGIPTVVWQSLRPNKTLVMTWEEKYGIYASESKVSAGATIESFSSTEGDAVKGKGYTLRPSGVFVGPEGEKSPGSYFAKNAYSLENQSLIMGLYQTAELGNGTPLPGNPVSFATVPHAGEAIMTPFTTLYVWIQSSVRSSTVVTEVTNPKTKVVFGGATTGVELIFNSGEGEFEIKGGKAVEGLELETFSPVHF